MSEPISPYMSWSGLILSLKKGTPQQRQYVEGILFALHRITDDPTKAQITAEQVGWLEELFDRSTKEVEVIDEIVQFMTGCLDDDEKIARDASGGTVVGDLGNWSPSPAGDEWEAHANDQGDESLLVALRPDLPRTPESFASGYWGAIVEDSDELRGRDEASPMPAFRHTARHDPADVLADIAAKRALLALHGNYDTDPCLKPDDGGWWNPEQRRTCFTLWLAAASYCRRPGFKPEWRLSVREDSGHE